MERVISIITQVQNILRCTKFIEDDKFCYDIYNKMYSVVSIRSHKYWYSFI